MKITNKLSLFFILFLCLNLWNCSGIKVLSKKDTEKFYSKEFLVKIGNIKQLYLNKKRNEALEELQKITEEGLNSSEKGMRRNLIGVILFSKGSFEQAIFNFEFALQETMEDKLLQARILLNLSSSYYKLGLFDKAFNTQENISTNYLIGAEKSKYHILRYKLAKELGKDREEIVSLIEILGKHNSLTTLKQNKYYQVLINNFFKLSKSEKMRLLEQFENRELLCVGYLGYLEVEKLYYKGQKEDAKDIISWLSNEYSNNKEVSALVSAFTFRLENYAKMNPSNIGLVIPLSGDRSKYGQRVLRGVDTGNKSFPELNFNLIIRDSEASGVLGANRVKELIENHSVSAIIGGLYPTEATKEYLEAKKHGVLFISLSQVYLPSEEKDHLLIEVPGSIESQVRQIFSQKFLNRFGPNAAIIYPNSKRGLAYVNEFWKQADLADVKVTGALEYDEEKTDFRGPVKNLLGLEFTRERKEEYDLLKEVYSLEKKRSIRRIQTLKPQIDFDWVFVPALPRAAQSIIPSFSYYDAFNLNIVGGPSWRSKSIVDGSRKYGKMYFIGDDLKPEQKQFSEKFFSLYNMRARIIEMRAYDAYQMVVALIGSTGFSSRDELDIFIKSKESLAGITGNWILENGIWYKEMEPLMLQRGRVLSADLDVQTENTSSETANNETDSTTSN